MAKRNPNPIDVHVGNRLRLRRMLVGMSQEKLGDQLDLTFQQVQKYEKGSNRISASRLFQMSRILDVPVQFFFDDMTESVSHWDDREGFSESAPGLYGDGGGVMDLLQSSDSLHLLQAFHDIADGRVRRRVVDLLRAMGGTDDVLEEQ